VFTGSKVKKHTNLYRTEIYMAGCRIQVAGCRLQVAGYDCMIIRLTIFDF
jgi:hypothetical protein